MDGTVIEWSQDWNYSKGRIEGADGVFYRCSGKEIELDSIGRCLLVPGEPVTFLPSTATSQKGRRYPTATNVKRPWKVNNIDFKTHREVCLVRDRDWLIREIGGLLVIRDRDSGGLCMGNIIECGVQPPPAGFRTWQAISPIFLADSEEAYEQSLLVNGGS